jgi:D-arabinonate dehydratase
VIPIATGEQESTRWGFRTLFRERAVDIAQPDVTVVGGVSEWLRVAQLATADGLPLAPHYFPEVHAQLSGAVPQTLWVEYFLRETDIVNFDDVLARRLEVEDGHISLNDEPGVGLQLDEAAVARFRVR